MSTQEEKLKAIADAIREKEGSTEPIPASDFPARILALETGGAPKGTCTIILMVSDPDGGTVTGGGLVSQGMTVTVTAAIADGYQFTGWQENGRTVSEDDNYTFTVSKNVELVAAFEVKKASRLPQGYTEVEYIHWDGDKTSFNLLENVKASTDRITLKFHPETVSGYIFFINGKSGTTTYYLSVFVTDSSTLSYMIDFNSLKYLTIDTSSLLNFDIDFYSKSFTVNGLSFNSNWSSRSLGSTNRKLGSSLTTSSVQGRFYQLTQYRNNEIIHDYVPCINPDGISGIFDINTETFIQNTHTNATGITPGPAV